MIYYPSLWCHTSSLELTKCIKSGELWHIPKDVCGYVLPEHLSPTLHCQCKSANGILSLIPPHTCHLCNLRLMSWTCFWHFGSKSSSFMQKLKIFSPQFFPQYFKNWMSYYWCTRNLASAFVSRISWQNESADQRRRRHNVVITQNACYINKLRSCFQFGPDYMGLTGHRGGNRNITADYRYPQRAQRGGLLNATVLMQSHIEGERGKVSQLVVCLQGGGTQ